MKYCKTMVLVPEDQCNLLPKAHVQDIPPAVKKSIQLDDNMSQLLDDSSAPKNHTKAKEFERLFQDYMHYRNHDTIPSFTQASPALEAVHPDIPAAFEKVSAPSFYSSMVLGHLPDSRIMVNHRVEVNFYKC